MTISQCKAARRAAMNSKRWTKTDPAKSARKEASRAEKARKVKK